MHHEKLDKKLTRSDPEQPEYLVLEADFLQPKLFLYSELHRPYGYSPLLFPTGPEIYNPASHFQDKREFLTSPAIYFFDFLHAMRDVVPHYDKLQTMSEQRAWYALESLLWRQMGDRCYIYDEDPSGMLNRRFKYNTGLPLYIADALLVASTLGIKTDILLGLYGAAHQQSKLKLIPGLEYVLMEADDEDWDADDEDEDSSESEESLEVKLDQMLESELQMAMDRDHEEAETHSRPSGDEERNENRQIDDPEEPVKEAVNDPVGVSEPSQPESEAEQGVIEGIVAAAEHSHSEPKAEEQVVEAPVVSAKGLDYSSESEEL